MLNGFDWKTLLSAGGQGSNISSSYTSKNCKWKKMEKKRISSRKKGTDTNLGRTKYFQKPATKFIKKNRNYIRENGERFQQTTWETKS